MREVNFSIPNVNKASVHITTTLYDRRALDCTSTLPLINSLNHLAYLTTSSARIRDILTVDGGVERLVCILKEGRSKDEMHMWKWNLAFQCIVNIGVRGSENVRTRVVEADMVPVIATVLWDYILVIEREKAKADAEQEKRNGSKHSGSSKASKLSRELTQDPATRTSFFEHLHAATDQRSNRRQAPPPSLDLPQSFSQSFGAADTGPAEGASVMPPSVFTSPPERTMFPRRDLHHHNRGHESRNSFHRTFNLQPPATAVPSMDTSDGFSLRPVREVDRLPSMLPPLNTGVTSHPDSPTTPSAPLHRGTLSPVGRRMRRPSIRHQNSTGDNDDMSMDDVAGPDDELLDPEAPAEGRSRAQTRDPSPHDLHELEGRQPLTLAIPPQQAREIDNNVDIAQQTPITAGMGNPLGAGGLEAMGVSPLPPAPTTAASPAIPLNAYPNFFLRNATNTATTALMPRDEDVLMGLQLLAYISKYCYLRHYFQATHLVPRLRIDREVEKIYGPMRGCALLPEPTEDEDEEFLQPDDCNIFPLVEKFTVRHHSKDMQYWACVVMRNLCRKDDARGGIRQCANYKCGKWEEYTRQFAKCRRCRRTKYCSKECQRESWSMHRHWCHLENAYLNRRTNA
ncbi:hypothetical protein AYL99_02316 [Fonsecaea erecta]|uniref:MYND-type zinc finger protein samB n=1 Tax=Fonsecaea erecta TaxID=1367422 RepID=A0A178ZTH5_9EURO|nr:hypothetical protein AYL99_02316 [Fonsecaea erecta]OAP63089.1 hypothetical protein AYL99_02316 [Fonsecaea erecta]